MQEAENLQESCKKTVSTLCKKQKAESQGYSKGKPGTPITRAELAAIASRFDSLETTIASIFADIKGHWAEKYINSAYEKGWVNGYPDGTLKPDQYITRAEFVTLVNNVLQRSVTDENILPDARQFTDLLKGMWYYDAMEEAINGHLYIRQEDGTEQWTEIHNFDVEM